MVGRRQFVKGGAAGLAGVLASRRAPGHAQGTRFHLLHRVDFIPQGEAELKRQLAEYGKQMKMEVTLEAINENDLMTSQTRPEGGSSPRRTWQFELRGKATRRGPSGSYVEGCCRPRTKYGEVSWPGTSRH